MALLRLHTTHGGARTLDIDWDGIDTVSAFVYQNLTDDPWTIRYFWKAIPIEQSQTVPPQTPSDQFAIPPGQQTWIIGGDGRHSNQLRAMST